MSRTLRRPTWEEEREQRLHATRAATLALNCCIAPASFCGEKEAFPSRNDARRAAKLVRLRRGRTVHSYPCPKCGAYHLTIRPYGE